MRNYRQTGMAARRDKVAVELDREIIERTRAELGGSDESDAAVVERALNAYLLGRVLDTTQGQAGLSETPGAARRAR